MRIMFWTWAHGEKSVGKNRTIVHEVKIKCAPRRVCIVPILSRILSVAADMMMTSGIETIPCIEVTFENRDIGTIITYSA